MRFRPRNGMRATLPGALAALLAACASPAGPAATPEPTVAMIVEQAAHGEIDVCGDPRWSAWRFGGREAQLAALRSETRTHFRPSQWLPSEPEMQVSRLGNALDAAAAAPDVATLDAAWAKAAQTAAATRAAAEAAAGADLRSARVRASVWTGAQQEAIASDDKAYAAALDCLIRPERIDAQREIGATIAEMILAGMRPNDLRDGTGSERLIFTRPTRDWFRETDGDAYCRKLRNGVANGTADVGPAVNILEGLGCNGTEPTAGEFVTHREEEWAPLRAYLLGLPAATVAEDLAARVTLEQIGIRNVTRYNVDYPADQHSRILQDRILALSESVLTENTERVKALLVGRAWFDNTVDGRDAQSSGFMIVQHADQDPDFQRAMLARWEKMLDSGRFSKPDFAVLRDRLSVHDRKPQRYATQLVCENGNAVVAGGLEDPSNLDKRRAVVDLGPWAAYRDEWASQNRCTGAPSTPS